MNKAVFLDRDGVINEGTSNYYISKPEDFRFNEDVFDALKLLTDNCFLLIVISNQSGIAKGLYTKEDAGNVHTYMCNALKNRGIEISEVYYCPHHEDHGRCLCRKPSPLMIEKAIARFNIAPGQSYMIGDSERDIVAGEQAGLKTFRISTNESLMKYVRCIIKIAV